MNRINLYSLLLVVSIAMMCSSCKKDSPGYTDGQGSFGAALTNPELPAGDAAKFVLDDNPDFISFYSGEVGHEYKNRERTVLEGGSLKVKFETRISNVPMDSSMDVMISNDFTGVYDSTNVANAHWKKMTGFFNYPLPTDPLSIFYPSGPTSGDFADFTDSIIPGQPFYFAFKYSNKTPSSIIWSINKMSMYNVFNSGTIANATIIDSNQISSGNFASVQINDPGVSRWSTSSTYLKCTNSSSAPIGGEYWYITRPLNPSAVAPDVPVAIKNITQNPLRNFNYIYSKPGIYTATFVAKYARLNYQQTIVKEFTVTVQ